ncbi:MAG: lysophospholipid acyltransferase family protein [Candidatus Adiutrix sp.]|nr:lysophospholipid acyltransferase family protein [Candidatus Adiutrix sp.]
MTNQNRLSITPSDFQRPILKTALTPILAPLNMLCGLSRLEGLYRNIAAGQAPASAPAFVASALKELGVSYQISAEDLQRLPKEGPVVALANHPYGGLEGLILADLMLSVRPDAKLLANHLLGRVSELRDIFLLVDPFKRIGASQRFNFGPLREALSFLKNGGALGLFPAGEVAHWSVRDLAVSESPWRPGLARLITGAKATVVPVFFSGHNGSLFQLLGLIHPGLRTAALPRELANKHKAAIKVTIGRPISGPQLHALGSDEQIMAHLQTRTMILGQRDRRAGLGKKFFPTGLKRRPAEIISAVEPSLMAAEINNLPPEQILFQDGEFMTVQALRHQIPMTMVEISRLREATFRAVGEGTGECRDIDTYDNYYTQLFVWNRKRHEIVGAYRLAKTDEIIADKGLAGLYSSTLFTLQPQFFDRLGPALELGRSFVRQEYQKDYAPLYLLWKGIGSYILQSPSHKTLFGLVSISNDYKAISRQLMADFYGKSDRENALSPMVTPRNAFQVPKRTRLLSERLLKTERDLNAILSDIEGGAATPVLLRHYLKLGGTVLKFGIDPSFSKALDGLIVVDLSRTETKYLERYMGPVAARWFKTLHGTAEASDKRPRRRPKPKPPSPRPA